MSADGLNTNDKMSSDEGRLGDKFVPDTLHTPNHLIVDEIDIKYEEVGFHHKSASDSNSEVTFRMTFNLEREYNILEFDCRPENAAPQPIQDPLYIDPLAFNLDPVSMDSTTSNAEISLQPTSLASSWKCDGCNRKYKRQTSLNIHKRIYSLKEPVKCDECEKIFSYKCGLGKHMKNHTREKLHKCDACEKRFSRSNSLVDHKRRSHTGEKPYMCVVCQKAFTSSSELTRHKKIHTGEKPYRCDQCEKTFCANSNLSKHKKTPH